LEAAHVVSAECEVVKEVHGAGPVAGVDVGESGVAVGGRHDVPPQLLEPTCQVFSTVTHAPTLDLAGVREKASR
jgi:hypothetical protein